ncbi:ABC transporter permease [Mycolicibacterium sp. 120266]|uniref:ABC transporter permease n=1 Tax=Mycolicibacterium sp. 120266 TaxID=3090601 RepID=UPI00299E488F|nr:ABC transporter permease [Mycolicibacterium sp. 120266]MDX1871764.1 ABC transporter permease [Mycolicibacterium sp. 120266]
MTITSEYLKLRSTPSPAWSALAVVVLSLGLATAIPRQPELGAAMFGVPVLMVLSALTVTGEYRTAMIRTTFLGTPNRVRVLAAKAIVAAAFSAVVSAVATLGSFVLATGTPGWPTVGAVSLYAVLGAVLAVGLGAVVRHSAAAVAVLLLLPFVVEPLLGVSPQLGSRIGPLLPFTNANAFTGVTWIQSFTMWWGPTGSALYFAAVAAAVFAVAAALVTRRDA